MNSRLTWLGVASSWADSAGRMGSTRPMPMKLTTQAKATAKTAFGCLNMLVVLAPCAVTRTSGRTSGVGRGWAGLGGSLSQPGQRGECGGDGPDVVVGELLQWTGQPGGAVLPAAVEQVGAGRGEADEHRAAVAGIGAALHQSLVGQPPDQRGHRGLADALGDRQVGEPGGSGPAERGERGRRGEAEPL